MSKACSRKPLYRITTLGCRVNQFESDSIAADLNARGWHPAGAGECADLCIINTCTVTAKAAMQSRQATRHAVRENFAATVVAAGCGVQAEPGAFAQIPGVHYVIGSTDKHRIPEIIAAPDQPLRQQPKIMCPGVMKIRRLPQTTLPAAGGRARPNLKIQDGCGDFCSYCIVPYTRGPSRSLPMAAAMEMISGLAAEGAREVVLTGIHLGRYGKDLDPGTSLYALLWQIEAEAAVDRVRLSSVEPGELSSGIIHLAAAGGRLCPHFHIPLQSGDPRILEKMKRPYSTELFAELIRFIHETVPEAAIGVDVLAGFPGEDSHAFENTYNLLASLPVAYLHVFPFSPRPQTPASRFPDHVDHTRIKERCSLLRRLSREKSRGFYQSQIGREVSLICEDRREASSGRLKGVSENYLSLLVNAPDTYKNSRLKCRLTGPLRPEGVFAELAE
ncbi:MAG: tRNA (N(6)-L-threonylcarbamoyladenosine(37)-C(2))-methylthiotransferase MtaB [Desulfosalsimonadaceae bacterium]